jgi:Spy/CpxP family protein refolding chaperone
MSRRIRLQFAFLFLLLVTCASGAWAQGFKWWLNDRYRTELGLTSEQSRRLEEIFQGTAPVMRTQKKTFDDAEAEFERLVGLGNDTVAMEQLNRVEAARGDVNKTRALMLLRMRRSLTTDQWVKLGALHKADNREKAPAAVQPKGQGK